MPHETDTPLEVKLISQAAPVAVPDGWRLVPKKITPQMIEGAMAAHYGTRRLRQAGGPGGVDMTVNCINYNGTQAMKRMWAGALSAAPTPPAQQSQADGRREGIEAVAKMIEKQASDYAMEFGNDDLGALSFGAGSRAEAKHDYYNTLCELAEEVRAMLAVPGDTAAPEQAEQPDTISVDRKDVELLAEFFEHENPHHLAVKALRVGEKFRALLEGGGV